MSKVRDISNLSNIIKTDASGNVSFVSGSTTLATINTSGQLSGSSPVLSSSYALNADLLDGLDSTQFTLTSSFAAQTASFTAYTASQNILNGTYATTGSNTFTGIQTVNSNLIVTGSITAQTLVVQTITSSVDFVTGSTRFGSLSSNTHVFTGSVLISGSSTALNVNSGSFFISSSGNVGIGTINPSTRLTISKPIDFAAYGSGSQAIDFKVYYPGFDIDTVKASIYVGVSSIAGLNTQSGYMSFMTSNAGTLAERMRIEKDGTIGIGTTIPSAFIDIRKNVFTPTSTAASVLIEERGTYQMGMEFYIHNAGIYLAGRPSGGVGTCNTAALRIAGGGIINGNLTPGGGTTFVPSSTIGSILSVGDGDGFIFYTTGSLTAGTGINLANHERMRITSAGNVGIGVTPSAWASGTTALQIGTAATLWNRASDNLLILGANSYFNGSTDIQINTGTANRIYFVNGAIYFDRAASTAAGSNTPWAQSMIISSNGSIGAPTGTNIYNASDIRLKQNVTKIENGLTKIIALNPIKFNWLNGFEESEDGKDMLGFIAQEVQNVIPEAVESFGNSSITIGETIIDNPLTVNEKFIIPVLVKAIQEQQAQINELKAQING